MLKVAGLLIILFLVCANFPVAASQEGTLPLAEFRLETANSPPLGRVMVSGSQRFPNFTRLEAEAFGKYFSLTSKQLQQLNGFSANGAQLSQISPGDSSGGGKVYLILIKGTLSDKVERKYVVFTADGKMGVGSSP